MQKDVSIFNLLFWAMGLVFLVKTQHKIHYFHNTQYMFNGTRNEARSMDGKECILACFVL